MSSWIWILPAAALVLAAVFRGIYELHHLQTARYEITSEKIRPEDGIKAVLLSDLHGRSYGPDNEDLLQRIQSEAPDAILCAGDMITSSKEPAYAESLHLFERLVRIAPVYAAPGNHEKWLSLEESGLKEGFDAYRSALENLGVRWLSNEGCALNASLYVSGLDTDFVYYNKLRRRFYPHSEMKKDLACASNPMFNIVLAHNPRFFKTYAAFGADLILSGHYHGGAVRFGRAGLISPQFRPFPRYSRGLYEQGGARMIVSAGCGSHKVNLRLFNKPEIVVIQIHGNLI